jgi:malate synthase
MYDSFLSAKLRSEILKSARPFFGISGLQHVGESGGLETAESLQFLVEVYRELRPKLQCLLEQRSKDRSFLDVRCKTLSRFNRESGLNVGDADYQSVLGLQDQEGRTVVGPLQPDYWRHTTQKSIAPLPSYLQGPHVTLFGPPDSAKMCINAMNSYHRELKNEPAIIRELLATHASVPKWGADDEDSKTPIRADLISAGENLGRCFTGDLIFTEGAKNYELRDDHLALPIKRFPGLALPCPFLFLDAEPLPLHLYDFVLHLFHHWSRPEALVFYVPKLENEEEARYIREMIELAEKKIMARHADYRMGTVRLMIVLENPRAVFRTHEIMDELYPYFAGASLGWHDFLASTARLFREDPNYRIPSKADPDIVIKYIKASHDLLARVVGPRGGIKVGGMYGILPIDNDWRSESFQLTLKGYFRDVFTQLKRDLSGFWVAHPDFVRLGLAMVEAWKFYQQGDRGKIEALVRALLDPRHQPEVLEFIFGKDVESLDPRDPVYPRSLIVSDLNTSRKVANHDPEEIGYNIFQSLQYLTDWLSGNGCVALPGQINGIPVRIMDDLATAERSRWEIWHEVRHGRVPMDDFLQMAFSEYHFIQKDLSLPHKSVQVKWTENNAKWYPVALKLMIKLMTDPAPPEFATELLLPFTLDSIRTASDPWRRLQEIDPQKYRLLPEVERFMNYFECCGHQAWANRMSEGLFCDLQLSRSLILQFSKQDIIEAARFHGNIGEGAKTLDANAAQEQAKVLEESELLRRELLHLGAEYQKQFGIKFLISAKGKRADEIRDVLSARIRNPLSVELQNAREALAEITEKRLAQHPDLSLRQEIIQLQKKHRIQGLSIAVSRPGMGIACLSLGQNRSGHQPVTPDFYFQMASLSIPIAAAFTWDYFHRRGIPLSTSVNLLFAETGSSFRLKSTAGLPIDWAEEVSVENLLRHEALNLHYVNGVPGDKKLPRIEELLGAHSDLGYDPVRVVTEPGTEFRYSGGGFLVLEHLIESLAGRSIQDLTRPFLVKLGLHEITFHPYNQPGVTYAEGVTESAEDLPGNRKHFPVMAAGALGTARGMQEFLELLAQAYQDPTHQGVGLSHDLAVQMLHGRDKGSREFMLADMGLGIFILHAGNNKFALHQGANDGFRCLFLHCFDGPDFGKGMTVFANGELSAVRFIAEAVQILLRRLDCAGIDFDRFAASFEAQFLRQEEVVNRGYKELIFSAFRPNLPEPIPRRGARDPFAEFNRVVGAQVLSCTDQRFALAENLISAHEPVFEVDLYGQQGKVMDSWESARHSPSGQEELILELSQSSDVEFIFLSTKFHKGNHVPAVTLEGKSKAEDAFRELLPLTQLEGHAHKKICLPQPFRSLRFVRVRTYPDGGLTRLGLFDSRLPESEKNHYQLFRKEQSYPYTDPIPHPRKPLTLPVSTDREFIDRQIHRVESHSRINFASSALGAAVVQVSNEHYGPASQVLSPYEPLHMFDGFESARSRTPGHFEECIVRLARPARIQEIEIDFTYFRNNNPRSMAVEYLYKGQWKSLVSETPVKAYAGNKILFQVIQENLISELKFLIFPDGGINRIRVY